jgi:cyclohexanone monooxygenase
MYMDKSFVKCGETNTPRIDLPALRAKYRAEADKRRRKDHYGQFQETKDDFIGFFETDPHTPPIVRDPVSVDMEVAVLGGGFAGLINAARLKQSGVKKLCIIEMGGDFGGTWYWNRYPGIQCDVEAYSYLPLLEELNYVPRDRYSYGAEIYEHCQRIGKHFGLYEHALFGTIIRTLKWDESIKRWRITTNRGDEIRAQIFVMGPGPLNHPKLPKVPGIKSFKAHMFHTSRWDYKYTGGDSTGGLTKLADKRVAIVGTGATAIQCVPHVGAHAKQLYVFQRTPSYVDERGNMKTNQEWAKTLGKGWQRERQNSFHSGAVEGLKPGEIDLICDGWTEINRNVQARLKEMGNPTLSVQQLMDMKEVEDYRAMERIRKRVEDTVNDKKTAEALKPWYRFNCKRPCFNDDYLPTFNRPSVTLVDVSEKKGIEAITEKGIVANGVEYEVDCIIWASGFEVTNDLKRRFAIETIEGKNGVSLYDHWGKGYKTLHGIVSHNFPNFFFTGYSQGGVAGSLTLGLETQARHIAYIVKEMLARGATVFECTKEAEAGWCQTIKDKFVFDREFFNSCTPGYFNYEGETVEVYTIFGEPYGDGFYAFEKVLVDWRETGKLPGLELTK